MCFGFIIPQIMLFELFSQESEFYTLIRSLCLVSLKRAGQGMQIPSGLKWNGADLFQRGTTRPGLIIPLLRNLSMNACTRLVGPPEVKPQ